MKLTKLTALLLVICMAVSFVPCAGVVEVSVTTTDAPTAGTTTAPITTLQ